MRAENDCLRKELQDVHTQLLKRHGLPMCPVPQSDGPALADSVAREAAERIAHAQADANAAARKAAVHLAEVQRVNGSLKEELEVLRGELHCRPTTAAHQYAMTSIHHHSIQLGPPFFARALQRRVDWLSRQLAKMHGNVDAGVVPHAAEALSSPRAVLQAMSTRTAIQRDRCEFASRQTGSWPVYNPHPQGPASLAAAGRFRALTGSSDCNPARRSHLGASQWRRIHPAYHTGAEGSQR